MSEERLGKVPVGWTARPLCVHSIVAEQPLRPESEYAHPELRSVSAI
jgi:hypothetical protein